MIEKIIMREWNQFQKVQNQGGRADCQDDWNTFQIMRESYFIPWSSDALLSYEQDLKEAELAGWNLVFEKYARMTLEQAAGEYRKLEEILPSVSEGKRRKVDKLMRLFQRELEEFKASCPNIIRRGRAVSAMEEENGQVSSETYLRCELLTYSERTLARLEEQQETGQNAKLWIQQVYSHMAKRYGYESLAQAEKLG